MFESLPGFRDFYPDACARRNYVFRHWTQTANRYGFEEYDIPTLESLELFTEKSGPEIVSQLFHFTDQGGREVALRPELTPSLARMIGAKTNSLKKPVKWFNIAENFRYERQQKGRLRSHYQFNADIFGEPGAAADAEIISLCLDSLFSFGLGSKDLVLRLSDRTIWVEYLAILGFAEEKALGIIAVIDKLERMPREKSIEALKPLVGDDASSFMTKIETMVSIRELDALREFLESESGSHSLSENLAQRLQSWEALLQDISAVGLRDVVRIDLGIVRGLAYYTGFVFEVFALDEQGELQGRALAGGGRYDHLIEKLGFPSTEAVGFGMGDVTLQILLEERKLLPPLLNHPDFFLIIGSPEDRPLALADAAMIRRLNYRAVYPLRHTGFGKQFKQAGLSGAAFTLIYGDEERIGGKVKIRDMRSGEEALVRRFQLPEIVDTLIHEGLDGFRPPVPPSSES